MATNKHDWNYENIGGSTRVKITTGDDIAHLGELDPKKWTVLSCPSTGLEIDEKSLKYMDNDSDGRIRVSDVVATSQWVTSAIKDVELLLKGADHIDIEQFNQGDANGKKLYNSSKQILANLGKEGTVISLADTKDSTAIFAKTSFNGDGIITELTTDDLDEKSAIAAIVASLGGIADRSGDKGVNAEQIEKFYQALADYSAWMDSAVEAPYGADTEKAIEVYNALDAKVKDYFVRAKLASFSPESVAKLDVQTALIETISADNLTAKTEEIAAYPIARITGKVELDIDAVINPAWAGKFATLMAIVKPKGKVITESDWAAIGATFGAPERTVCMFCGDGGFQMTIQELGTIMEQQCPVKMILLNNNYLGNVRQWQYMFFNKRYSFTPMLNPDYEKIAEGYGIPCRTVIERADLADAIKEMLATDGPYLLQCAVKEEDNVLPMTPPGGSVDDMLLEVK
jgi:hypothetical protein